jgi:hypothetical protein
MYVMIILTWLAGNVAGPTATSVNGFSSAKTCETARQELLDHYAWWAPHFSTALTAVCVAE